MVDLEDVLNNDSIKSNDMLHFIIEIFDLDIKHAVMLQRLFVCIIKETIEEMSKHKLTRKGDDLYLKDSKLNISIATKSAVSILIHIGINICSKDTPVKTISFHDLKINWTNARDIIMHKFKDEFEDIYKAISKVKPV